MGLAWAILALGTAAPAARAVDNEGLGPLSIRNQFPVTLAFLDYTPESPRTLPPSTLQVRYQFELSNTFVNTQSPTWKKLPPIVGANAEAGLTLANFPASGYGMYIDAETQRHLFRLDYGLSENLEVGIELAWISFGGGFLDPNIEGVERIFGGLNVDRTFSPQNRFDFYVVHDGAFLRATSTPTGTVAQDPVLNAKWRLSEGGALMPALTLKLSYKLPLESTPTGARALVSSGEADYGYYFLLSKAVGDVVGHIQWGQTRLSVAPNTFADRLRHRMFGLEYRMSITQSLILQSVTQSSIYLRSEAPGSTDFDISRSTDVMIFGYRSEGPRTQWELGVIEDYNQLKNEADISGYFEVGWRW